MSAVNEFLMGLPEWSLVVISTSLGWAIGSVMLYVWIQIRGGF